MIDDREAQAVVLARARANAASGLPLAVQDRVSTYRRLHGDKAAEALIDAYKSLPEDSQRRATPADAFRIAKERSEAWLSDFMSWQAANDEPSTFGE